jgi:hypothetical protein
MLDARHTRREFGALTSRVRVSDWERELAARRLRDAASAGKLSVAELDWRLGWVLSAATFGELEAALLDLPAPRHTDSSRRRRWLHAHVAAFAIVHAGLIAIWAAAGFGYFWPVWPMIGWGMIVAGHAYGASAFSVGEDRAVR